MPKYGRAFTKPKNHSISRTVWTTRTGDLFLMNILFSDI